MIRFEVLALCCAFPFACNENEIVGVAGNTVSVTFDIQEGFQGHLLTVMADSVVCLQAALSTAVPLAGPIATFNTVLTRDQHHLRVSWVGAASRTDSLTFILARSPRYFIGLKVQNDTLAVQIQDDPFLYL